MRRALLRKSSGASAKAQRALRCNGPYATALPAKVELRHILSLHA
jgi:hypothetical protein